VATKPVNAPSGNAGLSKGLDVALRILQCLVAASFLMSGASKLAGALRMVELFQAIGIGQWFRYFTGGLECVCAVGLLFPRTTWISAALLAITMLGAIITHLFIVGGNPAVPIVLLVLTATIARMRRPAAL
jgi:putative oxidoreductase